MGRPRSESLTQREAEIMEVLWTNGPSTADEIREALPDDPHDSSVRTKLRVLEEKGHVRHDLVGRAYVYRAAVRRSSMERKAVRGLLQRFFSGSGKGLLLRLIEDKHITPEQLAELQAGQENAEPGQAQDRAPKQSGGDS